MTALISCLLLTYLLTSKLTNYVAATMSQSLFGDTCTGFYGIKLAIMVQLIKCGNLTTKNMKKMINWVI